MPNTYKTVNERIKELIFSLEISQSEFSTSIKITKSTINGIIKGTHLPSFKVVQSILLKYPSLNANWLLTGVGEKWDEESGEKGTRNGLKGAKEKNIHTKLIQFMETRISELEREILEKDPKRATALGINSDLD